MDIRVELGEPLDEIIDGLEFDNIPQKTIPLGHPFRFGIQTNSLNELENYDFYMYWDSGERSDIIRPEYQDSPGGIKMYFTLSFNEATSVECQFMHGDDEIDDSFFLSFAPSGRLMHEGVEAHRQPIKFWFLYDQNTISNRISVSLSVASRIKTRMITPTIRNNGEIQFDYSIEVIREHVIHMVFQFNARRVRHHQTFQLEVDYKSFTEDSKLKYETEEVRD
ncbi:hypothetical protein GCK72_004606 [Caenorhabditis remanei]|uniref:Uncharacterized protein n=1 Tax=Caenorhabditis remanei TaxID=31234 RepID=A0A6A5HBW3_CAERE|nr:hypothetical protein GCK72_004606 [Caenorhabditis remanei]KAF1764657.1 hypothetical protein GCK72_004606 [Caenorhabditis remanei]